MYGQYQLLQDLRAIKDQMKNGPSQISRPHPNTIPHHTTILDTKDFFQIPLTAHYKDCFVFMAWKCNLHRLAQRFQWMALPPKIKKKIIILPHATFMSCKTWYISKKILFYFITWMICCWFALTNNIYKRHLICCLNI